MAMCGWCPSKLEDGYVYPVYIDWLVEWIIYKLTKARF